MGNNSYDAVIVGGGIVGTACAAELSGSGLRVALIEREFIGGGATAAGMGHIAVMDDSPAQLALTRYSQSLWKALASSLPASVEYMACGSIWVAASEEEMAEVGSKFQKYRSKGVRVEILDSYMLAEAEPSLRSHLSGGLLMPDDAVLYAPSAALYLANEARRKNADLFIGKKVGKISEHTVTLADGTYVTGQYIIAANGTEAAALLPNIQMQPRKGHLVITDRYASLVNHQLIELGYLKSAHSVTADSVAFNVQPRKTGQLLIGSSRQYGNHCPHIDFAMLSSMLNRAIEYIPSLAELQVIRSWTGFRAATPDKLPLIGAHPQFKSIYLATGHEGLGISTSLATATLLKNILLDRPSQIDAKPYLPSRTFPKVISPSTEPVLKNA